MRFHDIYTVTKTMHNFAKTFQAMIQIILLNCFLITFREIFLQGFGNIFYIFSSINNSFQEMFLKPSRNVSGNDTGKLFKWFPYNLSCNDFARFRKYFFTFQIK